MSFLADPPLLYATGHQLGRRKAPPATGSGVLALFYAVSIPLYVSRRGRGFMLNSFVLRFDPEAAGPRTHVVAALIFAIVYPLALVAGWRRGAA